MAMQAKIKCPTSLALLSLLFFSLDSYAMNLNLSLQEHGQLTQHLVDKIQRKNVRNYKDARLDALENELRDQAFADACAAGQKREKEENSRNHKEHDDICRRSDLEHEKINSALAQCPVLKQIFSQQASAIDNKQSALLHPDFLSVLIYAHSDKLAPYVQELEEILFRAQKNAAPDNSIEALIKLIKAHSFLAYRVMTEALGKDNLELIQGITAHVSMAQLCTEWSHVRDLAFQKKLPLFDAILAQTLQGSLVCLAYQSMTRALSSNNHELLEGITAQVSIPHMLRAGPRFYYRDKLLSQAKQYLYANLREQHAQTALAHAKLTGLERETQENTRNHKEHDHRLACEAELRRNAHATACSAALKYENKENALNHAEQDNKAASVSESDGEEEDNSDASEAEQKEQDAKAAEEEGWIWVYGEL